MRSIEEMDKLNFRSIQGEQLSDNIVNDDDSDLWYAFIPPYALSTRQACFTEKDINNFRCPITQQIMNDPVIFNLLWQDNGTEVAGSYTYERSAIINAIMELSTHASIELPIIVYAQPIVIKKQQIQQIMQASYKWCTLTDTLRYNHHLVNKDTVYWSVSNGDYYIKDRSGILQRDKVSDNLICKIKQGVLTETELKCHILSDIASKGYTMLLVANTSKKLAISAFLEQYSGYREEVPLPEMWKDKLCYLICDKSLDSESNQLTSIERCLQQDPRLLTTRLHYTVHDITSFNYADYNGVQQKAVSSHTNSLLDVTDSYDSDLRESIEIFLADAVTVQDISSEENMSSQEFSDPPQINCSALYLACLLGSTEMAQFLLQKLKQQDSVDSVIEERDAVLKFTSTNSAILCFPYADIALKKSLDINNSNKADFILWLKLGAKINSLMHDLSKIGNLNVGWFLSELDALAIELRIPNAWGTPAQLLATRNDTGDTPLHVAICNQHVTLVTLFLKYGANINLQNNTGDTPLHVAVTTNNIDLIKILLKFAAIDTINTKNQLKQTPIYLASTNKQPEILQLLVEKKFNNMLPLHLAIEFADVELLKFWLAAGSPIEARNHGQQTPIYFAVIKAIQNNHIQSILILLEHGANLAVTAGDLQQTLLHIASQIGNNIILLRILLKYITESSQKNSLIINQRDLNGDTALHIAAKCANILAAQALLRAGASYSIPNNTGYTVNEIAVGENAWQINKTIILAAKQRSQKPMLHSYATRCVLSAPAKQLSNSINLPSKLLSNGNFAIFSDMVQIINPHDSRDGIYLNKHNLSPQCIISLSNANLASVDNKYQIQIWLLVQDTVYGMQNKSIATLSGHLAAITCIQELANNCLASIDVTGIIKVWDLTSSSNLYSIQQNDTSIQCFALYLEGNEEYLICGSQDGSIHIWQSDNNVRCKINAATNYAVECLTIVNDNLLIAGFNNGSIQIVDLKCNIKIYSQPHHNLAIYCITSYNIEQNTIAIISGSVDGVIKLTKLNLTAEKLALEDLDTWQDNQEKQFHLFDCAKNNLVVVTKTNTGCTTECTNLQTLLIRRANEQANASSCCMM